MVEVRPAPGRVRRCVGGADDGDAHRHRRSRRSVPLHAQRLRAGHRDRGCIHRDPAPHRGVAADDHGGRLHLDAARGQREILHLLPGRADRGDGHLQRAGHGDRGAVSADPVVRRRRHDRRPPPGGLRAHRGREPAGLRLRGAGGGRFRRGHRRLRDGGPCVLREPAPPAGGRGAPCRRRGGAGAARLCRTGAGVAHVRRLRCDRGPDRRHLRAHAADPRRDRDGAGGLWLDRRLGLRGRDAGGDRRGLRGGELRFLRQGDHGAQGGGFRGVQQLRMRGRSLGQRADLDLRGRAARERLPDRSLRQRPDADSGGDLSADRGAGIHLSRGQPDRDDRTGRVCRHVRPAVAEAPGQPPVHPARRGVRGPDGGVHDRPHRQSRERGFQAGGGEGWYQLNHTRRAAGDAHGRA